MITFLQGLTLGFSASVSPGPFWAYLLTQTLQLGARRALPLALVPLLSDGPIVVVVLLVLAQTPAWFLRGLEVAGGLFMLSLAGSAFRAARQAAEWRADPAGRPRRSLLHGTLMNLLNPNPWIFWSVIGGPLVLEAWARSAGAAVSFFAGFYLTLTGGMAGLIVLMAVAHRLDPRLVKGLNLVSAGALVVFGGLQLYRGLTGA
ncbi:MAG: LysE family transporter [Anaerolineales bacterium]|nr:LysE family transporter [Anaerolineales bacterium]